MKIRFRDKDTGKVVEADTRAQLVMISADETDRILLAGMMENLQYSPHLFWPKGIECGDFNVELGLKPDPKSETSTQDPAI